MNRILAFALIFVASVLVTYWFFMRPEPDLPIYQPSDINPALVDASVRAKEDHRVMDFRLVNQLGDTVTLADVGGQILVTDFFFTRCATICPLMTKNLKCIHDRLPADAPVQLLSHSVTPEADSVSVLKAYADKHEADPGRWWFLTGPKDDIYTLARKSYFACLDEGDGIPGLCIPRTWFWMPKAWLLCGTSKDISAIQRLSFLLKKSEKSRERLGGGMTCHLAPAFEGGRAL